MVREEVGRDTGCIRAARFGCRGPTLGRAFRKNGSRRAASASPSAPSMVNSH
jgi:hypothetical protein